MSDDGDGEGGGDDGVQLANGARTLQQKGTAERALATSTATSSTARCSSCAYHGPAPAREFQCMIDVHAAIITV